MKLGKKMKALRKELGITQINLANMSGLSRASIQLYEGDKVNIPVINLEKISSILGVKLDYFLSTNMSTNQIKYVDQSNKICRPIANSVDQSKQMSPNQKNIISINVKNDTIYVPFFKDGAVSAGFGTQDFENDCDFLPFKKQDLKLMFGASNTANIGIIPCIGNSMQPTIEEGELIVFQQDNTQNEGAIYVVRFENELFVKRFKKRPLQLVSDNKEYDPIDIKEMQEIEILGRVIGSYSIKTKRF